MCASAASWFAWDLNRTGEGSVAGRLDGAFMLLRSCALLLLHGGGILVAPRGGGSSSSDGVGVGILTGGRVDDGTGGER